MFHTAQTDMANSSVSTQTSDAHRRALLTTVLSDEKDASVEVQTTAGDDASDRREDVARPLDTSE